jgi:hypothetical protein
MMISALPEDCLYPPLLLSESRIIELGRDREAVAFCSGMIPGDVIGQHKYRSPRPQTTSSHGVSNPEKLSAIKV